MPTSRTTMSSSIRVKPASAVRRTVLMPASFCSGVPIVLGGLVTLPGKQYICQTVLLGRREGMAWKCEAFLTGQAQQLSTALRAQAPLFRGKSQILEFDRPCL